MGLFSGEHAPLTKDIFIGNLSPSTSHIDLAAHLGSLCKSGCLQIFDALTAEGFSRRYAIATIAAEECPQQAIQLLNGKELHGYALVVREYVERDPHHELRAASLQTSPWCGVERRVGERRR